MNIHIGTHILSWIWNDLLRRLVWFLFIEIVFSLRLTWFYRDSRMDNRYVIYHKWVINMRMYGSLILRNIDLRLVYRLIYCCQILEIRSYFCFWYFQWNWLLFWLCLVKFIVTSVNQTWWNITNINFLWNWFNWFFWHYY